jgi:uncharacterized protein YecA (UPF0149 family)
VAGANSSQRRITVKNQFEDQPTFVRSRKPTLNVAFRALKDGMKELREKLGRNDLCPCGSGRKFQEMLPNFKAL